uniref:Terpene synthase metal-binding domain-containing protein n=1 Tax=Lactuca sativa TaxID=4236 RepID=A0A9R1VWJ7_LACSA|nr:hypothetical protein LSAT_V11C400179610 [Lactuca sativa]
MKMVYPIVVKIAILIVGSYDPTILGMKNDPDRKRIVFGVGSQDLDPDLANPKSILGRIPILTTLDHRYHISSLGRYKLLCSSIYSTLWVAAIFSLVALISSFVLKRKSLPPQPIESTGLEIVTDNETSTIPVKGDEGRRKGCVVVVADESIKKAWDVFCWQWPNPWWKELGLAKELKLARSQPLNWYLWPMASLEDPSLSEQRLELIKPIALIFIIDDIFDVYGTLDELVLFTEAVIRWGVNSLEQLPYHLRICIQALYDITREISDKIYKKYGFNPIEYLKRTWINLCEAFLVEAKWFASGHLPNADEYLRNGIVSSGVEVVTVHMFFLLGCATNEDSATIIKDNPGITFCLAKILRLWDDLGSAKDENQDGHDGSYVTYYMRENEGCSLENAQEHVMSMISNTWKQLNKECLSPNKFSAPFIKACLNLARMVPMMYNYDENHSLPLLKDYINSMF